MAKDRAKFDEATLQATADAREATEKSPEEIEAEEQAREAVAETPAAMPGGMVALTFEQLMALVKAAQGNAPTYEQMVDLATKAANAGADRIKPKELTIAQTPRKSAFNPDGERDHPRPKLKCHMYFGSAPLGSPKEVTVLTHPEIAALNALTTGHFRIRKMDGSYRVIEIKGQMNSNRVLDRLWILLPEGDDQQNMYPALAELATQCCDANRVTPEVAA